MVFKIPFLNNVVSTGLMTYRNRRSIIVLNGAIIIMLPQAL